MLRHYPRLVFLLAIIPMLAMSGCGKSALPKTYPAAGVAVFENGATLKGGSLTFINVGQATAIVIGEIHSDGSFHLRTVKDNEQAPGAPEGEYEVTVRLPPRPGAEVLEAHKGTPAIKLAKTYRVEPKENTFKIEVPAEP